MTTTDFAYRSRIILLSSSIHSYSFLQVKNKPQESPILTFVSQQTHLQGFEKTTRPHDTPVSERGPPSWISGSEVLHFYEMNKSFTWNLWPFFLQ